MTAVDYGRLVGSFLPGVYLILIGIGLKIGPARFVGRKLCILLGVVLILAVVAQKVTAQTRTPADKAAELGAGLHEYFGELPIQVNDLVRIDDVTVEEVSVIIHFVFTHPAQDQFKTSVAPVQEGAAQIFCGDPLSVDALRHGITLEMRFQTLDKSQTVSTIIDADSCS